MKHLSIRKKIRGTAERPRLTLYKSNTALYAQLIDDTKAHVLLAVDTRKIKGKKSEAVIKAGEILADKAIKNKVTKIVFDRAGYRYHGLVKILFDTVSKKILKQ